MKVEVCHLKWLDMYEIFEGWTDPKTDRVETHRESLPFDSVGFVVHRDKERTCLFTAADEENIRTFGVMNIPTPSIVKTCRLKAGPKVKDLEKAIGKAVYVEFVDASAAHSIHFTVTNVAANTSLANLLACAFVSEVTKKHLALTSTFASDNYVINPVVIPRAAIKQVRLLKEYKK